MAGREKGPFFVASKTETTHTLFVHAGHNRKPVIPAFLSTKAVSISGRTSVFNVLFQNHAAPSVFLETRAMMSWHVRARATMTSFAPFTNSTVTTGGRSSMRTCTRTSHAGLLACAFGVLRKKRQRHVRAPAQKRDLHRQRNSLAARDDTSVALKCMLTRFSCARENLLIKESLRGSLEKGEFVTTNV